MNGTSKSELATNVLRMRSTMDAFVQKSEASRQREPLADISNSSSMHHPANRPLKKVKVEHSRDSSEDESSVKSFQADLRPTHLNADEELRSETEDDGDRPSSSSVRRTEFEDALPPVATDKDAIEEYEAMRASQRSAAEEGEDTTAASNFDRRQWIRGKSSIYVDAFNLALDTVLEDEAHLFDTKEMKVFEAWRSLDYESQYLYVEKLTSYIRLLLK